MNSTPDHWLKTVKIEKTCSKWVLNWRIIKDYDGKFTKVLKVGCAIKVFDSG